MTSEEYAAMHREYEEQVWGMDDEDTLRTGNKSCKHKKITSIVHQDGVTYRWCDKHNAYCSSHKRVRQ